MTPLVVTAVDGIDIEGNPLSLIEFHAMRDARVPAFGSALPLEREWFCKRLKLLEIDRASVSESHPIGFESLLEGVKLI